ncbi:MAG: MFS transporter [Acidobacteriota bacterium]|nr:MFS transporter [Acidobacteriota bacterium]
MNRRWTVVALIFAGIVISYVDRGNLGIAASSMMRDFRFPPSAMGMLLSAFFWTYAVFQIPAGFIVDRIGIKRVYAGAFLLWSLASAAIALSRGLPDILFLRMLLGLAEAAGPIASLSFIRRNFPGAELGLPTSIYIAGQNIGPALGALLGTLLLDRLGWRAMFAITGLGALLWLPFWLWLAPRDRKASVAHVSTPRQHTEMPWPATLASRAFWAMSICIFLSSYYWFFLLTWVPTYLTSTRGFSTIEMGRVLSTPLFVMAALNIAAGFYADRLVKRIGSVFRVRVFFAAAGYIGAGAVLLLLVLPGKEAVLPILIVSVCSTGIGNSNFWAISQHTPPAGMVGRTIGYLNTVSQLAGAAAPLITGWILGPRRQFGVALLIAGVCPLLAAVCLIVAGPNGLERLKSAWAGALEPQEA